MTDPAPIRPTGTDQDGASPKRWGLWIAAAVLLLFMALNSQQVEVNLIFGSAQMPLIFALLVAALLGALVGWAAPRLRAHRRSSPTPPD
jgi:uncharacterized integral membrane protein